MCLQWGPLDGFPKEARVSGGWLLTLGTFVLALLWGCQFGCEDSCISDWLVLDAIRACSLCVTWGLWKGCMVHASGSVALCRNHSSRGRRNHKGYRDQ